MHHPTDRIIHTTAFVTPVVEHWLEREIAQWVHPIKDRSDDPSHPERTLLSRSFKQVSTFLANKKKKISLCNMSTKLFVYSLFVLVLTAVVNGFRTMHYNSWSEAQWYSRPTVLKEGRKCFIERRTQHILFTVIWRQTYGKGPFR